MTQSPRERAEQFAQGSELLEEYIDDVASLIADAVEEELGTSRAAGKEAEELRLGMEEILKSHESDDLETRIRDVLDNSDPFSEIRELLDETDARDANQWALHEARVQLLEEFVGTLAHGDVALENGTPVSKAARLLMGVKL